LFSAVEDSRSLSVVRGNGSLKLLARRFVLRASCSAHDLHKKHRNAFAGDFSDYLRLDRGSWIQPRCCCWNHRYSRRHFHPFGALAENVGGALVSRPARRLRSIAPTCPSRLSTSVEMTPPFDLWPISRPGCGVLMKNISLLFSRAIQG